MNNQVVVQQPNLQDEAVKHSAVDALRTIMQAKILVHFLDMLKYSENNYFDIEANLISHTTGVVNKFIKELTKKVPATNATWLEGEVAKNKIFDIAEMNELILKIGKEENGHLYEQFIELLCVQLNSIFYAETNRKKLFFMKYKALFDLIANEMKADSNRQPGQVLFDKGELWLRTSPPNLKTEIKQ